MHWLNFYLLQANTQTTSSNTNIPIWLIILISIAPLLTLCTAIANLFLASYVFRFTKHKNDADRNIKWFQELIYTPNKEAFFAFFRNLQEMKSKIPEQGDLQEEQRIEIMNLLKAERNKFMISFADLIAPIVPSVHKEIISTVDKLIDELTKAFDNDELKLNNPKTYQREIFNRITASRNKVLLSLFNYKG